MEYPTTLTFEKGTSGMCTYCSTGNYRKIYEKHVGPIPREQNGRSYEIHHIDGNRANNSVDNLKAVTIQEHYDIHYLQEDWAACVRIGAKMKLSPAELSTAAHNHNLKMVKEGTHPWLGSDFASARNAKLIEEGTHNFLGGAVQSKMNRARLNNGTHPFMKKIDGTSLATERVKNGTHPLTRRADGSSVSSDNVKNGTHPTQKLWTCEHCGVSGKGASNYSRHHKDKKCLLKLVDNIARDVSTTV